MNMIKQNQRSIRLFLVLFLAGAIYLDLLLITYLYNSQQEQGRNLQPSFEVMEPYFEDVDTSINMVESEEKLYLKMAKEEVKEDPSSLFLKGIEINLENESSSKKEKFNPVELPSLSIVPYLDIQSLRFSPLESIPSETDNYYNDIADLCDKGKTPRVLITDLFSFQSWWKKQTNSSRNRFKNCIRDGYVSFNLGVWSLPDISLLRYNDLIEMITSGTQWIYSQFHIAVTTGIVMGGYEYPRGILTVLERAGIEFLLIYHTSSNMYMPPPNSAPFDRFYGHGGLDSDGETFLPDSTNFYQYSANNEQKSVFETMQVVHVFGEETRLINNLVNIGCSSDRRSRENLQIWYDEVIRWMITQCSTQHPNNQHIVIMFNLLSNQCGGIKKAYNQVLSIQEYLNAHAKDIFAFTTFVSSIADYSQILAKHHKESLPVVSSSMYPCLRLKPSIHREIAVYTNKPYFKYTVRHTQDLFSYLSFFTSVGESQDSQQLGELVYYPLSYVRKVLATAQSRYFKGGIAVLPNMAYVMKNLTDAGTILSQVHTHLHFPDNPSLTFNLDDTFFKLENTIIDKTMEINRSEKIAIRIANKQNVLRHSIVKFQISYTAFCLQDDKDKLLNFQIYIDFEGHVWMYAEVTVEPLSFLTVYLTLCDASAYLTRRVDMGKEAMRIGNKDFGVVLQNTGIIKTVYVKNHEYPFLSQIGFYYGDTERRKRTGHRIFNSDEKETKTTDRLSFAKLDTGFYGYFKKSIEAVIDQGPLFSEVTQYFTDNVALITRVFNVSKKSVLKQTLQQQVLMASINVTQEMAYYMQTDINNDNQLTVDEADFSLNTIDTQIRTNMGHNYRAMHSTLQIKETKKTEGIRAITLVSDRLHAGGFHNSEGTLEVLLRRSSLWADVTDYPEPFRNQWTKEQGSTLSRSLDMMSSKGRKLMQAATIRDPHRFFYLMNTNTDKELQNLRMEDEDAPVIDRMNFYVHFDLFTNLEPAQPLLIREQTVDPLFIASAVVPRNSTLDSTYSLLNSKQLSKSVRVINLFKPYQNFNGVVIQLTTLFSINERAEDPNINMCKLFQRKVRSVEEVDITGFITEEVIKKNQLHWKQGLGGVRSNCKVRRPKAGDIRSYRVIWE